MRNGLPFSKPKVRLFGDPGEAQQYLGEAYNLLFKVRQFCEQSGVPVFSMQRQLPNGARVTAAIVGAEEIVSAFPPGFTVQAGRERRKPKIQKQYVYVFGSGEEWTRSFTPYETAVIKIPFDQITGKLSKDNIEVALRGPHADNYYGQGFGINGVAVCEGKVAFSYQEMNNYSIDRAYIELFPGPRMFEADKDFSYDVPMLTAGKNGFAFKRLITDDSALEEVVRFDPSGVFMGATVPVVGQYEFLMGGCAVDSDRTLLLTNDFGEDFALSLFEGGERVWENVWDNTEGAVFYGGVGANKKYIYNVQYSYSDYRDALVFREWETKETVCRLPFDYGRNLLHSAITHDFLAVINHGKAAWDAINGYNVPKRYVDFPTDSTLSLYRIADLMVAHSKGEMPEPVDAIDLKTAFDEFSMTLPWEVHFDGADVFGPTPAQQLQLAEQALPL